MCGIIKLEQMKFPQKNFRQVIRRTMFCLQKAYFELVFKNTNEIRVRHNLHNIHQGSLKYQTMIVSLNGLLLIYQKPRNHNSTKYP